MPQAWKKSRRIKRVKSSHDRLPQKQLKCVKLKLEIPLYSSKQTLCPCFPTEAVVSAGISRRGGNTPGLGEDSNNSLGMGDLALEQGAAPA